ncbi:MAG: hypothetical protein AAF384_20240, partial [Pseudomonadota bacterium]
MGESSQALDELDRRAVTAAWQDFTANDTQSRSGVREVIFDSWQRARDFGLDPHGRCAPLIEPQELRKRQQRHSDLLAAAERTWELLQESLSASDNVFVVADPGGVILVVRGNEDLVAVAARHFCGVGRDWSARASGTDSVGPAR